MKRRLTRRGFLRQAAAGGAGLVILANSRSARAYAANEKLNIALIGVGGRGKWYVDVIPQAGERRGFLRCQREQGDGRLSRAPGGPQVPRFPRDARQAAQADRRRDRRHAGPYPRHRRRHGDEGGQTCLRRETAVRLRLRSTHDCDRPPSSRKSRRRWATRDPPAASSAAAWN